MMIFLRRPSGLLALLLLFGVTTVLTTAQEDVNGNTTDATSTTTTDTTTTTTLSDDSVLIWSSTGGGWRAMFSCVGYANVFQQAGVLSADDTLLDSVATVSGGSWFSTQLFYADQFYNRSVMAQSPQDINDFVLEWMLTYRNISTNVTDETLSTCNFTEIYESENYDEANDDFMATMQDICNLLVEYDFDWALFIQVMLRAASTDYGNPEFVDTLALPENRISPLSDTDLLIQAALTPNSRIRHNHEEDDDSTAVYLGYGAQLFTVILSAAYIIDNSGSQFIYNWEDLQPQLTTYQAPTPNTHSWSDWEDFYLFEGGDATTVGTVQIDNTPQADAKGTFQTPFGGSDKTTVLQVAAISSAAAGQGSPLAPITYTQWLSRGVYILEEKSTRTVWRVLAGLAAGIGCGLVLAFGTCYGGENLGSCNKDVAKKWGLGIGICIGILLGVFTGVWYGRGSILVPTIYDKAVNGIYNNSNFDNFAVCSQWPNKCGEQDGFLIDGWFVDNPALVINVAHQQQKMIQEGIQKKIKVLLTNCNDKWDNTFNRAQYLLYFSTYFNQEIGPGEFIWPPTYYVPMRSPQIFKDYLDEDGLDAKLENITDSNMTTALLTGLTTVANSAFGVVAGWTVDILLLNANANITTYVVGTHVIDELSQPLADMASHIAGSQVLVDRVKEFVES